MINYKNKNFMLLFNTKKLLYIMFVLFFICLIIIPVSLYAQTTNNNTSGTTGENNGDGDNNGDSESSTLEPFERTIEYDTTVTESDKKLYEKWEKDITYGVSKKKIEILEAIVKLNKEFFLPLITKILENEANPEVIIAGINAASRLQYFESSEAIAKHLDTENLKVLAITIKALGTFKYVPLAERLEEFLDSKNIAVKDSTIYAIGKLKREEFTSDLIDMFYDPDLNEALKESIIMALGMIGNKESCEFLLDIYNDETNTTSQRSIAFRGLIINKYGNIEEHLKKAFSTNNIRLKYEALLAMLLLKKEEVPIDIIYIALKDDEPTVRSSALKIIATHKFNDEKIIEFLKYIIVNDPIPTLKYIAVGTYLTVSESDAVAFIEERIAKGDKEVKYAVSGLLDLLPKETAVKYAKEELNSSTYKTKEEFEALLTSIRNIKDGGGLEVLVDVAENPQNYQTTKSNITFYQLVIKELTKFENKEKLHTVFLGLIEKKSKTALTLYPDLYTDDMVSVMLKIIKSTDYGYDMQVIAIWNIIQYGVHEDHLKLKAIYDDPNTDKKIKDAIKNMFAQVGIDINLLGKDA